MFKKTEIGSKIIKEQIEFIKFLTGLDVRLDFFGDMDKKDPFLICEINYYEKNYPKSDIMKGQRHLCSHISCNDEDDIIFDLQKVIDPLYVMKFHAERPHELYYPNQIPHKPISKKKMEKLLKDSVPLR